MEYRLPRVQIEEDFDAMSRFAADRVLDCVRCKPDSIICVATGASPVGVYACMAEHKADLRQIRVLKLDEWGGLPMDDPSTCETYIRRHILGPWDVSADRYEGFTSDARDPEAECRRVETAVEQLGGIDVCILGMGADGHIGLNYPAEVLPAGIHPTDASTLRHAMLDAALAKPTHGFTLGMADVLRARSIVLVVNGAGKADAIEQLLCGGLTPQFPASFLWLHPDVTCVLDRAASCKVRASR